MKAQTKVLAGLGVAGAIAVGVDNQPQPSLDELLNTPEIMAQIEAKADMQANDRMGDAIAEIEAANAIAMQDAKQALRLEVIGELREQSKPEKVKTKIITKYRKVTGKSDLPNFHRRAINKQLARSPAGMQELLGGVLKEGDSFEDALDKVNVLMGALLASNQALIELEAKNKQILAALDSAPNIGELDRFLLSQGFIK